MKTCWSVCLIVLLASAAFTACVADETVDLSDSPVVQEGVNGGHSKGTDTTTLDRESVSIRKERPGAEKFTFQAEVNRLMDIIIHSLYSNTDIFLRELISNASDALDKIRFLSLTDKSVLGEGDTANLEIRIDLDSENKVLTIRDRGIGMTREELVKNLGTIAKSGTSAFLEQMQKGGDINLIGQFGVGFYSVYLVSDYVEVITKHNDDKQYIWSSTADGSFSIVEDEENEPLGRGTLIKIHLKPEAQEYAEEAKLKDLVHRYSEFINFPIYMMTEKEIEVPVEETEESAETEEKKEEAAEADATEEEEEDEVEDEEEGEESEEEEEEEKPKTRKEKVRDWEVLNDNKAIWLRKPSEVGDEEYQKFYKAVSKDFGEALNWSHFKAEGDVEFRSILYIPKTAPFDFYDSYYTKSQHGLKLYVRRVFISDNFEELIPKYLSFLRGIVDSDTLPLNVSREMLQAHSSLKTIKKKMVRKALDMIKKMADEEKECKNKEEEGEKDGEKEEGSKEASCTKYKDFWTQFGKAIKLGIIEDNTNRGRLSKLLRFHTSKSTDELTSLEEYVSRMKEGQKQIYFLAGTNKEELLASPFLERLVKKDYEVILFTDVLDEYVMQHLLDYDDFKFQDATKEDLKLSDKDEKENKKFKELKEEFKPLTTWWKKVVSDVTSVKVSNRLHSTPCIVVTGKFGQSANMERIMKAQAFGDPSRVSKSPKTLEINPRHPLIKVLKEKSAEDAEDPVVINLAKLLYDTALLESGFTPEDTKEFSQRMLTMMKDTLKMEGDIHAVEEEDLTVEEEEVEVEEQAETADGSEEEVAVEETEDVKDEL